MKKEDEYNPLKIKNYWNNLTMLLDHLEDSYDLANISLLGGKMKWTYDEDGNLPLIGHEELLLLQILHSISKLKALMQCFIDTKVHDQELKEEILAEFKGIQNPED